MSSDAGAADDDVEDDDADDAGDDATDNFSSARFGGLRQHSKRNRKGVELEGPPKPITSPSSKILKDPLPFSRCPLMKVPPCCDVSTAFLRPAGAGGAASSSSEQSKTANHEPAAAL